MSWKFAEWRWREQARLRERPLWNRRDGEDDVKIGDLVDEAVSFAYRFPDQVDGCRQSRISTSGGGRFGNIRSATSPHPQPRCQLPDLPPQHHLSHHPSRSSSVPLLGPSEKTSFVLEESRSASSSFSSLLSKSIGSTPFGGATPCTPQAATDFLDSRDWNHLVLDQRVNRISAVEQLRSSFGLFKKPTRASPLERSQSSASYYRLERAQTSNLSRLNSPCSVASEAHTHHQSQDSNASFVALQDCAVPWSNLATVFEEQQLFAHYYFSEQGRSIGDLTTQQAALEISPFQPLESFISSHRSTSFLLPNENMGQFNISKQDEQKKATVRKRKDTPPARVFETLPAAYTGILGQSKDQGQEMRNMTSTSSNLTPLINLPKTPIRPGPASPAIQQRLAEARERMEGQHWLPTTEYPVFPTLSNTPGWQYPSSSRRRPVLAQDRLADDTGPAGDFKSKDDQIKELRRTASHESIVPERVLVRNSRSFFDLDRQYRDQDDQNIQRNASTAHGSNVAATAGAVDIVSNENTSAAPRRASNVLVRNSLDILGIAISGDTNYTVQGDPAMPAALRTNRSRLPVGKAPQENLPEIPAGVKPHYLKYSKAPSSGVAEYDNTQSLLKAGRLDLSTDKIENDQGQMLVNRSQSGNTRSRHADKNWTVSEIPAQASADTEFGNQLSHHRSFGLSQEYEVGPSRLNDIPKYPDEFGTRLTKNSVDDEVDADGSMYGGMESTQYDVQDPEPSVNDENSSGLVADKSPTKPVVAVPGGKLEAAGRATVQQRAFLREPGSAEWFANAPKRASKALSSSDTEGSEDERDWETIRGSGIDHDLQAPAAPRPSFEQHFARGLGGMKTETGSDPSLADISSSSSPSASDEQPVTLCDPISKGVTRMHPARPGTPHKYRLRQDAETGEAVYVPEYSFSEGSAADDPVTLSPQAAVDLPQDYLLTLSKFGGPSQQHHQQDNPSFDQSHPSSSPLFSRRAQKARMNASKEEHDIGHDRVIHELEGDQGFGIGVAITTDVAEDARALDHTPQTESAYSFASGDIIQDDPIEPCATAMPRPANIPGHYAQATTSDLSSDEASTGDGMKYGEQDEGIEMKRMGAGRKFSNDSFGVASIDSSRLQNSSSHPSLRHQASYMSRGRNESNEDLLKRLSTIQDDGSYEDLGTISALMRATNNFTPRSGKSSKRNYPGAGKTTIGSSPLALSSDAYEPDTQRRHRYDQLSSGPSSVEEAGQGNDTDETIANPSIADIGAINYLTQDQVKAEMQAKGVEINNVTWGNVKKDITGVIFPMGQAISAPRPFVLPRTIPPVNSFALSSKQPFRVGSATQEMVEERIEMAMDDYWRLGWPCPLFPLRDSHLDMKFVEGDPRRAGTDIYDRCVARATGRTEEDGFCFFHDRREFSTLPSLRSMPLSAEAQRMRKKAGRELVYSCLAAPVVGWIMLYYIWKDAPALRVDGEVMRWKTSGLVSSVGREERELAGRVLVWCGLGSVGGLFAVVALLLWALL